MLYMILINDNICVLSNKPQVFSIKKIFSSFATNNKF